MGAINFTSVLGKEWLVRSTLDSIPDPEPIRAHFTGKSVDLIHGLLHPYVHCLPSSLMPLARMAFVSLVRYNQLRGEQDVTGEPFSTVPSPVLSGSRMLTSSPTPVMTIPDECTDTKSDMRWASGTGLNGRLCEYLSCDALSFCHPFCYMSMSNNASRVGTCVKFCGAVFVCGRSLELLADKSFLPAAIRLSNSILNNSG